MASEESKYDIVKENDFYEIRYYPERLIDFCLNTKPTNTGCDLVDIVYVLYKCLDQVEYKRNEIVNYMEEVLNLIYLHYKEDEGGFSYSIDKSQEYYYGLRITKGSNQADIHGTILLTWALSMIFFVQENEDFNWKILKPTGVFQVEENEK